MCGWMFVTAAGYRSCILWILFSIRWGSFILDGWWVGDVYVEGEILSTKRYSVAWRPCS